MIVSDFQFVKPYLEELTFKVNKEFAMQGSELNMQNEFTTEIKKSTSENQANVRLTLESNADDPHAPFYVRISVASDFKWGDMSEEMVESMLKVNAPALLLGYMRPIVADITNSSGFPAYNIPFINFKDSRDEKAEEKADGQEETTDQ